jgi:hypothetical protein
MDAERLVDMGGQEVIVSGPDPRNQVSRCLRWELLKAEDGIRVGLSLRLAQRAPEQVVRKPGPQLADETPWRAQARPVR